MTTSSSIGPDDVPATSDGDGCDVIHTDTARIARVRRTLMGADAVLALAETFKALGDTTRVRILDVLSKQELCVCDIASLVGQSPSAVSHQLRLLRGMRLVKSRRAGRMVYYVLDDQHIVNLLQQGLTHVDEAISRASHG